MPSINDFDIEDDEQRQGGGEAVSAGSGGGGATASGGSGYGMAKQSKQSAPAFVGWERFTAANDEVSKREAGKLQAGVEGQVDKAMGGLQKAGNSFGSQMASNYSQTPGTASEPFGQRAARQSAPADTSFASSAGFDGITKGPTLKASARDASVPVANDLESHVGAAGWGALTGDVDRADKAATALGTEAGVEGMLRKQATTPTNTAFDAALISGAGGQGFRDYAKQFGGGVLPDQQTQALQASQDAWGTFTGDVGRAKAEKAAADAAAAAALQPGAPAASPGGTGPRGAIGGGTVDDLNARANGFADASTGGTQLGNRMVAALSSLSPENWDEIGQFPQGQLAEQIGSQYGLDTEQARAAFKDFLQGLDPKLAAWILGLVRGSGSNTGRTIGNIFGFGDALHGETTKANSSDEEWATFQQLFHEYLDAQKHRNDGEDAARQEYAASNHQTTPEEQAAADKARAAAKGRR